MITKYLESIVPYRKPKKKIVIAMKVSRFLPTQYLPVQFEQQKK